MLELTRLKFILNYFYSKKPKLRMHTGTNDITLRWVSTDKSSPGIDLTGTFCKAELYLLFCQSLA